MDKGPFPTRTRVSLIVAVGVGALISAGMAWAGSGGSSGTSGGDTTGASASGPSANASVAPRPYRGPRIRTPNSSRCDFLDTTVCLQPWPNNYFTTKFGTPTGRRLNLQVPSMPKNLAGAPIDPVPYNRNDGFSPVQPIVVHIRGLDNQTAFDRSKIVPVTDIRRYADRAQPVVVIDTATRRRHPIFAEMDSHATSNADRQLIIHPTVNLEEGHRYVVALRNLRNARGRRIQPSNAFRVYRDKLITRQRPIERRRKRMEAIFRALRRARIARKNLVLAWDFTVASEQNLSGRALAMRDDAFNELGDTNLANGTVQGTAPATTITGSTDYLPCTEDLPACEPGEDPDILRNVEGTLDNVPCYLDQDGCPPGAKFAFSSKNDLTPNFNLAFTMDVPFECLIPHTVDGGTSADPARPAVFGHGLLGDHGDVDSNYNRRFAFEHNLIWCAVDWAGFADEDIAPVIIPSLVDLSKLAKTFDRTQQGYVNFMYMARAMRHMSGLNSEAAFNFDFGSGSEPVIANPTEVYFEGISQGGIMGGALTALSPDFKRSTLNVNGQGYSTLLQRSVDFDAYAEIPVGGLYPNYPSLRERPLILSLLQIIWDRGDASGYAHHMTTDPLADTPPHQVLMHLAYGDHQVANVTAEAEARTVGARIVTPALKAGRHWEATPFMDIPSLTSFPFAGSALVYWDGGPLGFVGTGGDPPGGNDLGTGKPPNINKPNRSGEDPHSYPRRVAAARAQISDFWNGMILFACGGTGAVGSAPPCFSNGYLGIP